MAGPNRLKHSATVAARTIDQYRMIQSGQRVLVALSGGPDSTALTLVLRELGYPLHLCHIDHQMRPDSDRDAAHCLAVAAELDIGISVRKAEIPVRTEAAARRARYAILEEEADKVSADRIATGHTRDDQAETVRIRLERGGFGLGIPPKRGRIVRPIIELSKSDAVAVCEESRVAFVQDPSNLDPKYTRNRIRSQLQDDPAQTEALLRIGAQAFDQAEGSSDRLDRELERTVFIEGAAAWVDRAWICGLGPDDARLFVSQIIRRMGFEPHRTSVLEVVGIVTATGKRVDLGGGLTAWTDATCLRLGRWEEPARMPETELAIPGVTEWGTTRLSFEVLDYLPPWAGTAGEVLDLDATGPKLWVKQWKPGDRFRPLGSGEKKLQDFFTDQKLPRLERSKVPLVHNGIDIVWVAGLRIADGFKVTASTKTFLLAICDHL